jgi:hypothetical protein
MGGNALIPLMNQDDSAACLLSSRLLRDFPLFLKRMRVKGSLDYLPVTVIRPGIILVLFSSGPCTVRVTE